MAKATFLGFKGEKSALLSVRQNKFQYQGTLVYVPADSIEESVKEKDTIEIPDGFTIVDFTTTDVETGEVTVRTTRDGIALKTLAY